MRLAHAQEVVETEEAQVVEAGVDEDEVVDGATGKQASSIIESY